MEGCIMEKYSAARYTALMTDLILFCRSRLRDSVKQSMKGCKSAQNSSWESLGWVSLSTSSSSGSRTSMICSDKPCAVLLVLPKKSCLRIFVYCSTRSSGLQCTVT